MWTTAVLLAAALLVFPPVRSVRARVVPPASVLVRSSSRASPDPLAVAGTFDLLAACLRSGLDVAAAAGAASTGAPESLAPSLRRASDLLALGAEPVSAWESAASDDDSEALARIARRSARSGAPLADAITELAAEKRALAEDASAAAAERAGVLISGPLGLCFLPAFVCLGIVPVVMGLAGSVLSGGLL